MIYLASPYTHPESNERWHRARCACIAAGQLMKQGHHIFSPIAHSHAIMSMVDRLPHDWEFWRAWDLHFIDHATHLWVLLLPSWRESVGVQAEIKHARSRRLPLGGVTWPECKVVELPEAK